MKNLTLSVFVLLIILSCKQNKPTYPEIAVEEIEAEEEIDESIIEAFEKELDEVAIGGDGIMFENGKMTFDIASLETSVKQAEEQLNDIKEKYTYDSESLKQNAIESMELNLNLFRGEFCCTTHNGEHCKDSKQLRELQKEHNCKRFKKND